jgi:hypothetical protein
MAEHLADSPREHRSLISFPLHALLIVEERLREQQAEGVRMPEGCDWMSWR